MSVVLQIQCVFDHLRFPSVLDHESTRILVVLDIPIASFTINHYELSKTSPDLYCHCGLYPFIRFIWTIWKIGARHPSHSSSQYPGFWSMITTPHHQSLQTTISYFHNATQIPPPTSKNETISNVSAHLFRLCPNLRASRMRSCRMSQRLPPHPSEKRPMPALCL